MTSDANDPRGPAAFVLDDPRVKLEEGPVEDAGDLASSPVPQLRQASFNQGRRWGALFLSAVGGLAVLSILLWVQDTIVALLKRSDWLGWAATALFILAGLALMMIIARELSALFRLSAIVSMRTGAELALAADDARKARAAAQALRAHFAERAELATPLRHLKRHDKDIMTARQILSLHERELLIALDKAARTVIGQAARRVSAITSISPAPIAVAFVAYENFKMLRLLAGIYGGRPGFFAVLRLVRQITAHLAVTGGMALTDDFIQQFIGHGLTAKLSRRLGEGLINGAFTVRIGLASLDVVRPLPYLEASAPRIREFVAEFVRVRGGGSSGEKG